MPNEKTLKKPIHPALVAIIGFAAGILLTSAWFIEARLGNSGGIATSTVSSTTSAIASTTSVSALVTVHDQKAGSTVLVDSVSVPAPGVWVAVAPVTTNGYGPILGAERALGPMQNLTVHLLRATLPGSTYAVVLYRDNGDGVFNPHTDSIYVDFASGQRIVALFNTLL